MNPYKTLHQMKRAVPIILLEIATLLLSYADNDADTEDIQGDVSYNNDDEEKCRYICMLYMTYCQTLLFKVALLWFALIKFTLAMPSSPGS